MVAAKTIRFWRHYARSDPMGVPRFVFRRAAESLRTAPQGQVEIDIDGVRLPLDLDMHVLMRKFYFRTHEMFLERVFSRHVQPGQIFLDIGANCGYWSAFAASRVGPTGEVHSFEPVHDYFENLLRLQALNPGFTFHPNECAVGAAPGFAEMDVVVRDEANFSNYNVNIGSNSMSPGFLDSFADLTHTERVEVTSLDHYLDEHDVDVDRIGLIKIDVEGFESKVLDGMEGVRGRSSKIPLLVEIVTAPDRSPDLEGAAVIERLTGDGYRCLDATSLRPVDVDALGFEENILCV